MKQHHSVNWELNKIIKTASIQLEASEAIEAELIELAEEIIKYSPGLAYVLLFLPAAKGKFPDQEEFGFVKDIDPPELDLGLS